MAKPIRTAGASPSIAAGVEELLLAALERGGNQLQTGRFLITFRDESALLKVLDAHKIRVTSASKAGNQTLGLQALGDAEVVIFPEIGVAVVGGDTLDAHKLNPQTGVLADDPNLVVEPEYFVFAHDRAYLRGFVRAVETIAHDLGIERTHRVEDLYPAASGVTWGLQACKVPASTQTGTGIKVAVLDTGMDLGHPDFAGRPVVSETFCGQPVQDLHGHGTHCIGTASGTSAPPGTNPRYGIAFASRIHVGKVLTNSGSGTSASVLAGMNWAIANRCEVISMSLGSQSPVSPAYTSAGEAALRNGCLIVAAAGNAASNTGAPANSPTIMSVASLDSNFSPSSFSNFGKIEIAAPGRDVFSSWPRPTLYRTISGTSMATPHVAGCAALWAQTNPALRGMNLWRRLETSARRLPLPADRIGAGLVQAP